MLAFPNGDPFTTGLSPIQYVPTSEDRTPRLLVHVEIEGIQTQAIVDTGSPYVVIMPDIAQLLDLDPAAGLQQERLRIRGLSIAGRLYRLTVSFPATNGDSLDVDATAFVPDPTQHIDWRDLPSFVGLQGCLERMRFAVDLTDFLFYFGPA